MKRITRFTIGFDITVLNDPQKTGIGVYTYELIKQLIIQNPQDKFILFALTPLRVRNDLKKLDLLRYKNVKLKTVIIPAKLMRLTLMNWQKLGLPKIEKFIGKVDIFHSFNFYLPPQGKGRVIATVYDLTPLTHPNWHHPRTVQMERARLKQIAKKADLVVTISENSKQEFLKFFPNKEVKVIYPSAAEIFTKQERVPQLANYYLSVATLEPRKNLLNLVRAYLLSKVKDPLLLVGASGWKNEQLLRLIKKNPKKIRTTGYVSDKQLAALYQGANCLIYPSLYEGFGIPILEAFRANIPVITSSNSSLAEAAGEAALYVNPKDVTSIERAINKLTKDKTLQKRLISKGKDQLKKFSWEKSAKRLAKIYHESN